MKKNEENLSSRNPISVPESLRTSSGGSIQKQTFTPHTHQKKKQKTTVLYFAKKKTTKKPDLPRPIWHPSTID